MADNIPLSEWSGSGATRELHATVRKLNETIDTFTVASQRQLRRIEALTWALTFLTVVILILTAVQVYSLVTDSPAAPAQSPAPRTAP